jgi:hypothetical protein
MFHPYFITAQSLTKSFIKCVDGYKRRNIVIPTPIGLHPKYKELKIEWHPTKNLDQDIDQLNVKSNYNAWWTCALYKHEFQSPISARILGKKSCPICVGQSNVIHYERRINKDIQQCPRHLSGDLHEDFIFDLLKQDTRISKVERHSMWFTQCDIVVHLAGLTAAATSATVQLQVKTLYLYKDNKTIFYPRKNSNYSNDLLIANINPAINLFHLIYARDIPANFTFDKNNCVHGELFDNKSSFLEALVNKLPHSTPFQNIHLLCSKTQLAEYEMFLRLQKECEKRGLTCYKYEQNYSTADVIINDKHRVQMKFRTQQKKCVISASVNCGKKAPYQKSDHQIINDSKPRTKMLRPYNEHDDFDFLIVEISSHHRHHQSEKMMFELGNFYIFPKQVLIDKHIISTKDHNGITCITVHSIKSPSPSPSHWTHEFYNNFSFFLN